MAQKRMIRTALPDSEDYGTLDFRAQAFFVGLIALADDQGRFRAHANRLASCIFPYHTVMPEDIEADLKALIERRMVLLYEVNGQRYGQLLNWWKHQQPRMATSSMIPAPEGWTDREKYRGSKGIITKNWDHPGGFEIEPEPAPPPPDDSTIGDDYTTDDDSSIEIVLSDDTSDSVEESRGDELSVGEDQDGNTDDDPTLEFIRQTYERKVGPMVQAALTAALKLISAYPDGIPDGVILEAFDITAAEAQKPCWAYAEKVIHTLMAKGRDSPRRANGRRPPEPRDYAKYATPDPPDADDADDAAPARASPEPGASVHEIIPGSTFTYADAWLALCGQLRLQMSEANYRLCVAPIEVGTVVDGELVLHIPAGPASHWWGGHQESVVRQLQGIVGAALAARDSGALVET